MSVDVFNIFDIMDYQLARQQIEQRRQQLQQRMQEVRSQMALLKEELDGAERELRGLNQIHTGIDIAAGLREPSKSTGLGLTALIRKLLADTRVPLTPVQIRDACEAAGIPASSRRHLLIEVHTILKRTDLSVRIVRVGGKLAYLPRLKPGIARDRD